MNTTYTFDGSTDARGRNGWFQLDHVDICAYDWNHNVTVWMYSKVHAKMAPIYLEFSNPEELRQLICGLAKALHCMTNPEEDKP